MGKRSAPDEGHDSGARRSAGEPGRFPAIVLPALFGASATLFRRWQPSLPGWIRLLPLELPGRGLRFGEALHTDAASLVAQLAGELQGTLDSASPYAFFGHSLGGLLAFELAHAMRRRGLEGPLALFLSGVSPPAENDVSGYRRAKADAELVAALRDYRGYSGGRPQRSVADADAVASGASGLSRHRQLPLPGAWAAGRGAAPVRWTRGQPAQRRVARLAA